MSTVHITQITDLHLGANEQETLGGVTTFEGFNAALQASDDQGRADTCCYLPVIWPATIRPAPTNC